MKTKVYPNGNLEEIRKEAMTRPVDPDLVFRLQKILSLKKVEDKRNPFEHVTPEEGSKLLNTEIE